MSEQSITRRRDRQMKKAAVALAVAGAIAALPATAWADPEQVPRCEHGQLTAAFAILDNGGNSEQFQKHFSRGLRPCFNAPHQDRP